MATSAKDFDQVFEEELHEIRLRREVCGLLPKRNANDSSRESVDEAVEDRIRDELAGLALSGGGVRSAAFNLGLLQALYHSGRMRDIDYLSTVSGGGYAGALFSASVANDQDGVNWERDSRFNRLPFEQCQDGRQPARIYELALHGRAMSRPLQWLSRHLWGWILTILFVISGVISVASLLAWGMRIVWSRENFLSVQSQGFVTDLHVIFYPAFLALLLWAFCNAASVLTRALGVRIPPISRYAYVFLIATFVLGVVSFAAIGDVDISSYVSADILPQTMSQTITDVVHFIPKMALAALSLCLLPMLAPHKLMESGRNREKPLYKLAFNIAGFALICGVPLAVFFLLSRENVSSHNRTRPNSDMMTNSHLNQLEEFIPLIATIASPAPSDKKEDSENDLGPENWGESSAADPKQTKDVPRMAGSSRFPEGISLREQVTNEMHHAIVESGQEKGYGTLRKQVVKDQQSLVMPVRILQYVAWRIGLHDGFAIRVDRRLQEIASQQTIVRFINSDVLTNPFLFESDSEVAAGPSGPLAENSRKIPALPELEKQLTDAETKALKELLNKTVIPARVLLRDYEDLIRHPEEKWHIPWLVMELRKKYKLPPDVKETWKGQGDWYEDEKIRKEHRQAFDLDEQTTRLLVMAAVMDELRQKNRSADQATTQKPPWYLKLVGIDYLQALFGEPTSKSPETKQPSLRRSGAEISRNLSKLQELLQLDSLALREMLDDKLEIAAGDDRKNLDFAIFKKWHEAERDHVASQIAAIRIGNWAVLAAMYPDYIKPRDTVYAWNVNAADQSFRLQIATYSTVLFLLVGLLANLNNMCLHGVYRDQLASVWLPTGPLLLKDLNTCRRGGPLHLLNATLNRHGAKLDPDSEGMARFVFSSRFCGSKRFGYRETWEYENGEMGLADAVAISGAAVSTSYVGDLLFRTLLFLTNFRLGQWVRNPKHFHEEHYWPSPLRVLISQLWHPTDRAYVDLTDGGHLDNTGLASLLERRCRVMILGDCSQDADYTFENLFSVLHDARAKYGIQIEEVAVEDDAHLIDDPSQRGRSIDPLKLLIPDEKRNFQSQSHFAIFRVKYPRSRSVLTNNKSEAHESESLHALLIVIKPTLTGDEPVDLLALRKLNDGFPNDSTVNQFLDPEQFESYVMLGRHIGEQLHKLILGPGFNVYKLPSPWRSGKLPKEEFSKTTESAAQPEETSNHNDLPGRNAVGSMLNAVQFDEAGIGVAIALVRQWAKAEEEKDRSTLSANSEIFDNVIGQVSQWAREAGQNAAINLRRLFCSQLIKILYQNPWIETKADGKIRHAFRDMLVWLGTGVSGTKKAMDALTKT